MSVEISYVNRTYSLKGQCALTPALLDLAENCPDFMKGYPVETKILDTLDWIIRSWAFILPGWHGPKARSVAPKDFAEMIRQHGSQDSPRIKYSIDFLEAI